MGKQWKQCQTLFFLGSKITADGDCSHEIKRRLLLGRKVMTNLDNIFKSRDITLLTKVHVVKAMVFPLVMYGWGLDNEGNWALKNWFFWTVVLEKALEGHLDCKEIKPVNPKGNESWMFIVRTDVEAEALIFWPPDAKSWENRKDHDAGKDRRQGEKGKTEDDIVEWHHRLAGHEFKQALGVTDGQECLACSSPQGHKSRTWLSNRTTAIYICCKRLYYWKEYLSILCSFWKPCMPPTTKII